MAKFHLEEDSIKYGITSISNGFLLDYGINADAEYFKIYIFILMRAQFGTSLSFEALAKELNVSVDHIFQAIAYWERRGLIRKLNNNEDYAIVPYSSLLSSNAVFKQVDNNAEFLEEIHNLLNGRQLHGSEYAFINDWLEVNSLAKQIIILFLHYMKDRHGVRFSFKKANAVLQDMLANIDISDKDDSYAYQLVEEYLNRESKSYKDVLHLLRSMGQSRKPTDFELDTYKKWINDYGINFEYIYECAKETIKGDPNFGYLDGVIKRRLENKINTIDDIAKEESNSQAINKVLQSFNSDISYRKLSKESKRFLLEVLNSIGLEFMLIVGNFLCFKNTNIKILEYETFLKALIDNNIKNLVDLNNYLQIGGLHSALLEKLNSIDKKIAINDYNLKSLKEYWIILNKDEEYYLKAAELYVSPYNPIRSIADSIYRWDKSNMSLEQIQEDINQKKRKNINKKAPEQKVKKLWGTNYDQRSYTDDELNANIFDPFK